MQSVNIFGSTGSIGTSTLDVISDYSDKFYINLLSAGSNVTKFAQQILQFRPKYAYIESLKAQQQLQLQSFPDTKIITDVKQYYELLAEPHDIAICGIVGSAAILSTLYVLEGCKTLGLANKEVVICAYSFLKQKIDTKGVRLVPLDSEHNAIYQMLGYDMSSVRNITITASGGPFYGKQFSEFYHATAKEAIAHPTWSMGAKISVDSATMMNKGLEFIEACELFSLPSNMVKIIVHRQSKVHAIANLNDGSSLMQVNEPDMKVHIARAFISAGKGCLKLNNPSFDLTSTQLTFENLDTKNFVLPQLARDVYDTGDLSMRINFNNTNEKLVQKFLEGQIKFGEIIEELEEQMAKHKQQKINNITDLLEYINAYLR